MKYFKLAVLKKKCYKDAKRRFRGWYWSLLRKAENVFLFFLKASDYYIGFMGKNVCLKSKTILKKLKGGQYP